MMRTTLGILACAALAAAPLSAQSVSNDLNQVGNGARSAGLGNAFTAVADDATAISWNPAGMAQLLFPEASLVVNARLMYPGLDIEDADLAGTESGLSSSLSPVNFASLVYPIHSPLGTVVVGAAYRDVYDWKRAYEYTRSYESGQEHAEAVDGFERSGGIKAVSLGAAFAPIERLMLGASASRLHGSTESITTFDVTGNTSLNRSERSRSVTSGYNGTAIELGTLVTPTDRIRLGLRVGLPYERSSVTQTDDAAEFASTLSVPATWTIGAAVTLDQSSRMSFDYKHEPWSQAELTIDGTGETVQYADHDLNSLHLGYEKLALWGPGMRAYRVGAFTRPVARNDAEDERKDGYGLSAGLGWARPSISFDIAATYLYMQPHARWSGSSTRWFNVQDNELLFTAGIILYR